MAKKKIFCSVYFSDNRTLDISFLANVQLRQQLTSVCFSPVVSAFIYCVLMQLFNFWTAE